MAADRHREETWFEGCVNAPDGRPFVQMTCALDGVPVFAVKMSPAVCTALGLRAVQAAIEAERDAGMVDFLLASGMGEGGVGAMLGGMRAHREQFDADAGSVARLGPEDPSSVDGEGPPEG